MRKAIGTNEEQLGFTLENKKCSRKAAKVITDLDFVDDICLLSNNIDSAQAFLLSVKRCCKEVGLNINASKTEFLAFNSPSTTNKFLPTTEDSWQ